MIQLYYLAGSDREHRFDQIFQSLDVVVSFFPVVNVPSLVSLVTRDKMVNQQNFILCDLAQAEWSDEHILSAVQMLRRFCVAKPIFIAPPDEHTAKIFKLLADQQVDGLIQDEGDVSAALSAVLQGDSGYTRRLTAIQRGVTEAARKEVTPLKIPPGLVIDVAVCGAMPRVGTTTQAFALYHYMERLGFQVAILDRGDPALKAMLELYRDRTVEIEGGVRVNGMRVARERTEAVNAYITDYGVLMPEWVKPVCGADLSVLVGGVKPWELPELAAAYATMRQGLPHELITLISFGTPEDMEAVGEYLEGCVAVAYHPDLWRPGSDSVYRAAVLPALMRVCGQC